MGHTMGALAIPGIASGFFEKCVNVTFFAKIDLRGTPRKRSRYNILFLKTPHSPAPQLKAPHGGGGEQDLLYAYQGLKDTTEFTTTGEESVEDHLPTSITQGVSNLHSDEDMEDKIKILDPRVQKLIRTYLEVFGELPPPASCDKLVQMDLKLKPEFVGHKIRRRPYPVSEAVPRTYGPWPGGL